MLSFVPGLIKWNHMQGKQLKDPLVCTPAFIDHFILPAVKTNNVLYPCLSNYIFKRFLQACISCKAPAEVCNKIDYFISPINPYHTLLTRLSC